MAIQFIHLLNFIVTSVGTLFKLTSPKFLYSLLTKDMNDRHSVNPSTPWDWGRFFIDINLQMSAENRLLVIPLKMLQPPSPISAIGNSIKSNG